MIPLQSKLQHNYSKVYRILIALLAVAAILALAPKRSKFQYEFSLGLPWVHAPLYAPFTFAINKTEQQVAIEKKAIINNSYLYFKVNKQVVDSVQSSFNTLSKLAFTTDSLVAPEHQAALETNGLLILQKIYTTGLLAHQDSLANKPNSYVIKAIDNHNEIPYEIGQLYTVKSVYDSINSWTAGLDYKLTLRNLLFETVKPNILFNAPLTRQILNQKLSTVSLVYGKVNEGEKIVDKGEVITPEVYAKLSSLKENYQIFKGEYDWVYVYLGYLIYVSLSLLLLVLTIRITHPMVYSQTNSFTLILVLFVLSFALANVPKMIPSISVFMLPFALFAVVLQSFFAAPLASMIYVYMVLFSALIVPSGIDFTWIMLPAGLLAILLLNNLRKRSQIISVNFLVFFSSSILYIGASIVKEGNVSNIDNTMFGFFAISALLTVLAIPLVYAIEKIFGLISEMALLELSDTNNTLLRQLAEKAPGTFQHSMQVANLAEACALEIGGNPLLVRTGALYHDIGKMNRPEMFIENQMGGHNPHSDLSEIESAQIIIGHVINGIEIAKSHKLPEMIIDFIRSHHGTTTARYFYYQAKKVQPEIDKSIFQYPGPLPYSKETAILMLCDGVEAAARSLKEHTADSINTLIDGIFTTILEEHQLDYAPITFKDISTLKKLLQKKIMNIYHVRVAYPSA